MIDLNQLRDQAYKCACNHGFHDTELSNEHFLMLVITELSEAVEADRKGRFHYVKKFNNQLEEVEEWKPISGHEEDYEVSNLGRVRSKDLWVWNGRSYYKKSGKLLSPGVSGTGYYTVSLRGKTRKVAKLVANEFLLRNEETDFVNHIDGNKLNDNVNNLEFVSPSQNNKHALVTGLRKVCIGKLSYEDCVEIAHYKKLGINYTTIHKNKSYGVTRSAIQRICNNYTKYTDSVEFELADAFIRLLDLAGLRNIEIEDYSDEDINTQSDNCNDETFTESIYAISIMPIKTELEYCCPLNEQLNRMLLAIFGLAKHLDIDLLWHIQQKMRYNQLRPSKHGKKY